MAESLQQVANVAFMETHLPGVDQNAVQQQGKKKQGTLWDQEKDELSVRILIEEGKLNLCLRVMQSMKESERSPTFQADMTAVSKQYDVSMSRVIERCKTFERALGSLLLFAFRHVEAMQILDLPNLMAHCAQVLQHVLSAPAAAAPAEIEKMQEAQVVHYLYCLALHMEEVRLIYFGFWFSLFRSFESFVIVLSVLDIFRVWGGADQRRPHHGNAGGK
jgi:hypothetical protein